MTIAKEFTLPDLVATCPFPWTTSPYFKQAGAESAAWIDGFNVFPDRKRAAFLQIASALLVSHVHSYAGYEEFRTCCDFVNLLFVIDEISDRQDGAGARITGENFLKAMSGELGEGPLPPLSRITGEFRQRFLSKATKRCEQRFLAHCHSYIRAVTKEAELRKEGQVLDIKAYRSLRRENSAVRLCFGLFEYVHAIDLPDEVFEDPIFTNLYWTAVDMVCFSNDLYSYNMEQAQGLSGNNILTVLMKSKHLSLQQSADLVGVEFNALQELFLSDKSTLRSFGDAVDEGVRKYVFSLENWIVGNLIWSFESQRYFGANHREVQRTLVVKIREPDYEVDDEI